MIPNAGLTVGIDARKLSDYGIGTYLTQIGSRLTTLRPNYRFIFYTEPKVRAATLFSSPNVSFKPERSSKYSPWGLVTLSVKSRLDKLALFHSPHYVAPCFPGCPLVVTIHDVIHLLYPEYLRSRAAYGYARMLFKLAARRSTTIITVSHSARADIVKTLGVKEAKVRVIYNAIGPEFRIKAQADAAGSVKELGLRSKYLLYVGNIMGHKNIPALLRAFARLLKSDHGIAGLQLAIRGGEPDQHRQLMALAQALRISDRVVPLPRLRPEALVDLYNGCQGLILPSLYEGFGLPVLEAMACGAVVTVSRIPVMEELVGAAAVYFDPHDEVEMAEAMKKILTDSGLRERLRALSAEWVRQFSWDKAAQETIAVYEEILQEQS